MDAVSMPRVVWTLCLPPDLKYPWVDEFAAGRLCNNRSAAVGQQHGAMPHRRSL